MDFQLVRNIQRTGNFGPDLLPGKMTGVYLGMCIFWGQGLSLHRIFEGSKTPPKIRATVEEKYGVTWKLYTK